MCLSTSPCTEALCSGRQKHIPMRFRPAARNVPADGLHWGQRKHIAGGNLRFVPLENQRAIIFQHAETLAESCGDVCPPVLRQFAVLGGKPRFFPRAHQVRRIEYDERERAVSKWQRPKIHPRISGRICSVLVPSSRPCERSLTTMVSDLRSPNRTSGCARSK